MAKRTIDGNELKKLYLEDKLTPIQIAAKLGFSESGVDGALRRLGVPRWNLPKSSVCFGKGEKNSAWKGGRHLQNGYVMVRNTTHPKSPKDGYMREHILVWEKVHSKLLPEGLVVHHLNGIKSDNRPQNLKAMPSKNHHSGLVNEALKKRIRELECENQLLNNALRNNQLIWSLEGIGEN